jgi:flagellar biosynthesis/type III secretory pathway chaperone
MRHSERENRLMKQLIIILKAQITLYTQLVELSKSQTQNLVVGAADQAQVITEKTEKIIKQLSELESKRQNIIDTFMITYKINGKVELEEFVERIQLDSGNKTVILDLIFELEKIAEKLKFCIHQNKILLQKAMQFIDFNMNLLTSTTAGVTYAPKGQDGNVISKKKIFDQSI